MFRLRADRRITAIRARLRQSGSFSSTLAHPWHVLTCETGYGAEQVAELTAATRARDAAHPAATIGAAAAAGAAATLFASETTHVRQHMSAALVRVSAFPVFTAEGERRAVEVVPPPLPEDIPVLPLRVPQQYKILGYNRAQMPALGVFPPSSDSRVLREGARNESSAMSTLSFSNHRTAFLTSPPCVVF